LSTGEVLGNGIYSLENHKRRECSGTNEDVCTIQPKQAEGRE